MATGPLADALERDLLADQIPFDSLGWRGLWCYITKAPSHTAVFQERNEGWTFDNHLAAEMLYELRKLGWRYTAIHFERGKLVPFPEPIWRPGVQPPPKTEYTAEDWSQVDSVEDLVPPEVRELLKG